MLASAATPTAGFSARHVSGAAVVRSPARVSTFAAAPRRLGHEDHPTVGELAARPGQDLLLLPGQLHFGAQAARLRTLLGSCVAITLWHPVKRLGGMCHFLLPSRKRSTGTPLDGRYGDEAVQRLLALLARHGTRPQEYVAHLYGGADALPDTGGLKPNIGERNIELGWTLIDRHCFQLEGVDVGDCVPRTVALTLASGEVQMQRGAAMR